MMKATLHTIALLFATQDTVFCSGYSNNEFGFASDLFKSHMQLS